MIWTLASEESSIYRKKAKDSLSAKAILFYNTEKFSLREFSEKLREYFTISKNEKMTNYIHTLTDNSRVVQEELKLETDLK